jgi:hypothetical protein
LRKSREAMASSPFEPGSMIIVDGAAMQGECRNRLKKTM